MTLLTTQEIAELLKCSKANVLKLTRAGKIPGIRVGHLWRFDLERVMEALQRGN